VISSHVNYELFNLHHHFLIGWISSLYFFSEEKEMREKKKTQVLVEIESSFSLIFEQAGINETNNANQIKAKEKSVGREKLRKRMMSRGCVKRRDLIRETFHVHQTPLETSSFVI